MLKSLLGSSVVRTLSTRRARALRAMRTVWYLTWVYLSADPLPTGIDQSGSYNQWLQMAMFER
jgi:hypothetical protein